MIYIVITVFLIVFAIICSPLFMSVKQLESRIKGLTEKQLVEAQEAVKSQMKQLLVKRQSMASRDFLSQQRFLENRYVDIVNRSEKLKI